MHTRQHAHLEPLERVEHDTSLVLHALDRAADVRGGRVRQRRLVGKDGGEKLGGDGRAGRGGCGGIP